MPAYYQQDGPLIVVAHAVWYTCGLSLLWRGGAVGSSGDGEPDNTYASDSHMEAKRKRAGNYLQKLDFCI